MKKILAIICVCIVISGVFAFVSSKTGNRTAGSSSQVADKTFTLTSGGHTRSYLIHVPMHVDVNTPYKMILAFHGLGDTSGHFARRTGFSALADKNNFIVVYPESYISSWADGRNMAPEDAKGINDMQFARDVVADVVAKYPVDTAHIFATGFSSGGYFTHKLACEETDIFKAFAPIGAGFPDTLTENCSPTHARSLMFVEGSEDSGEGITDSGVNIYSADETVAKWADINVCTDAVPFEGEIAQTALHSLCKDGTQISETIIVGAGHSWVRDSYFDTSAAVMDFFKKQL